MSRLDDALYDLRALDVSAARPTVLARFDPRAKTLVTLAFIIAVVSFDRYAVAALLPFALFPVALAVLGEVPLHLIGRKLLLAAPFAVMVGMFNPLFDHSPQLELAGVEIAGGWISFTSILLRFALTVGAAVVLIATTGFHNVCAGLSRLGVPQVFTTQLLFLHRYASVLAGEAARMHAARELRACGQRSLSLPVYASLLGHLLLRALERAGRIHQAMVARGFDGEVRSIRSMRWRAADTRFVAGWLTCFVLARSIDLPRALGDLLLRVMS